MLISSFPSRKMRLGSQSNCLLSRSQDCMQCLFLTWWKGDSEILLHVGKLCNIPTKYVFWSMWYRWYQSPDGYEAKNSTYWSRWLCNFETWKFFFCQIGIYLETMTKFPSFKLNESNALTLDWALAITLRLHAWWFVLLVIVSFKKFAPPKVISIVFGV